MNILSVAVYVLGILSLILSVYLWWFFHKSKARMGKAVKWVLFGEAIATCCTLLLILCMEKFLLGVLPIYVIEVVRLVSFIVTSVTSLHMAYQIEQIE